MSLISIAGTCGVTTSNLERLVRGEVTPGVAGKIGITMSSLQTFVDGGTSVGLAGILGTTSSNLQDLRNQIGKQGSIGLIVGLMSKQ